MSSIPNIGEVVYFYDGTGVNTPKRRTGIVKEFPKEGWITVSVFNPKVPGGWSDFFLQECYTIFHPVAKAQLKSYITRFKKMQDNLDQIVKVLETLL